MGLKTGQNILPSQADDKKTVVVFIDGAVYNVTDFMDDHPGGKAVIARLEGRDATTGFTKVGHSLKAYSRLKEFLVEGETPGDYEEKPPIELLAVAGLVAVGPAGSMLAQPRRMMLQSPPSP